MKGNFVAYLLYDNLARIPVMEFHTCFHGCGWSTDRRPQARPRQVELVCSTCMQYTCVQFRPQRKYLKPIIGTLGTVP